MDVNVIIQSTSSIITSGAVIFGMVKVVNRNNEEWRDREIRLIAIEKEIADQRKDSREVIALGAQLERMESEIKRVRDRLDQFLDNRGGVR